MSTHTYPEFRWLERGQGQVVVLLHGLMGQAHHWDDALDVLGRGFRVIAPMLPIFDPGLPKTSIGELACYVGRLLDRLGIEEAVVGGHSLGGHVAIELALTRPQRVPGLILTGSASLFERDFSSGAPYEYVRQKMSEIFYDAGLVTPEWVESVRRTFSEPATALRVLRFARSAKRDNVMARLGQIGVPTLVVWGADDHITPPAVAERFQALIPDAKLVMLSRCGHAPMLERPLIFAAAVRAWLEDTQYRSSWTGLGLSAGR